jgi:hypothetical protein
VGDEQDRRVEDVFQLFQLLQDLCLDGHV